MTLLHQLAQLFEQLHPTAQWLLRSSWQAAVLAILILALQLILGRKLSARWRYNLWLLVVIRLLLPAVPQSPISIYNLMATTEPSAPHVQEATIAVEVIGVVFDQPAPTQPPAALTPSAPTPSILLPTLAILYTLGLLLLLSRTLLATLKLALQCRRFPVITDPAILALLDEAKSRLHIRRRIALLEAPGLATPALMGLLRPRILLPVHILQSFERDELRLIFLHELAHLRRHDIAINWLTSLLAALHWFNPLIHLAFARLRVERELACDELVLGASQQPERRQYGNTMIKLLSAFSRGRVLPGAVGILEAQAPLRRRITMIAQFQSRRHLSWLPIILIAILAMICFTDGAAGQQGQNPSRGRGGEGAPRQPNPFDGRRPDPAPGGHVAAHFGSDGDETGQAATAATRAALKRRIPEVNFKDVPLVEAITFLQELTGVNFYVDWRAVEGTGLARDIPIQLKLKDVPASEVLRLLLREASPELRYDIQSGIVIVSPHPAQPVAIIKAYAVDDLTRDIRHLNKYRKTLEQNLQAATEETQKEKYRQELEQLEQTFEIQGSQRLAELVQLIETTVAPFAPSGLAVRSFNGKLIVTADEAGHQEVAKVLQMLGHKPQPTEAIDPAEGKVSN